MVVEEELHPSVDSVLHLVVMVVDKLVTVHLHLVVLDLVLICRSMVVAQLVEEVMTTLV